MIVIWIAAIVVFGIVEAVTVGLVSIWFVLGAVAGLLAAVLGTSAAVGTELIWPFFAVGGAAVLLPITETIDNTVPTGAVYADGKTWTARSASGRVIPKDTMVKVQRMEGVRLFVEEEAGQPVHS